LGTFLKEEFQSFWGYHYRRPLFQHFLNWGLWSKGFPGILLGDLLGVRNIGGHSVKGKLPLNLTVGDTPLGFTLKIPKEIGFFVTSNFG